MILMTKAKDWIDKRTDGVVAKAFYSYYCIMIWGLSRKSEWVLLLLFAVVCCCCLFSGAVFFRRRRQNKGGTARMVLESTTRHGIASTISSTDLTTSRGASVRQCKGRPSTLWNCCARATRAVGSSSEAQKSMTLHTVPDVMNNISFAKTSPQGSWAALAMRRLVPGTDMPPTKQQRKQS